MNKKKDFTLKANLADYDDVFQKLLGSELAKNVRHHGYDTNEWTTHLVITQWNTYFNRMKLKEKKKAINNLLDQLCTILQKNNIEYTTHSVEIGYGFVVKISLDYVINELTKRKRSNQIIVLQEQLNEAVNCEDYELAAIIRDELNKKDS